MRSWNHELKMFTRFLRLVVPVAVVHQQKKTDDEFHLTASSSSEVENVNVQKRCQRLVEQKMLEVGAPGMVVAVSHNGKLVWCKGFGFSDVENQVPCHPGTVMRVASISKSFTASALCRLLQDGLIDLDQRIQHYVPQFPEKMFDGKKIDITLRQLLSHTSGIRHYEKSAEKETKTNEYLKNEYYSTKQYDSIDEALEMFKDDNLVKEPGNYFYSTHAYTLVSAAMEKASGKDFLTLMQDLYTKIGMQSTVPDVNDKLIYGRSRYYMRNDKGQLCNVPEVNNSYKWAGGGFLSTVGDLVKFGDAMMYSYQASEATQCCPPGILKQDTVKKMWRSIACPERKKGVKSEDNGGYGLGWEVCPETEDFGCCWKWKFEALHTGGAIGASSVLFLLPDPPRGGAPETGEGDSAVSDVGIYNNPCAVRGVSVAIITNIQNVGLARLARRIAYEFRGFGYSSCDC